MVAAADAVRALRRLRRALYAGAMGVVAAPDAAAAGRRMPPAGARLSDPDPRQAGEAFRRRFPESARPARARNRAGYGGGAGVSSRHPRDPRNGPQGPAVRGGAQGNSSSLALGPRFRGEDGLIYFATILSISGKRRRKASPACRGSGSESRAPAGGIRRPAAAASGAATTPIAPAYNARRRRRRARTASAAATIPGRRFQSAPIPSPGSRRDRAHG